MQIIFFYDFDKIIKSPIGKFATGYYSAYIVGGKKIKARDNFEKIVFFFYHLAGKLAVYYLNIATQLWLRTLTEDELTKIIKDGY